MRPSQWFVIASGEEQGRAHMSGWMGSAMRVLDDQAEPTWWAYSHCPRCFAVVQSDDRDKAYGDMTWAHERWHAATDFPIPPEVAAKVTRP